MESSLRELSERLDEVRKINQYNHTRKLALYDKFGLRIINSQITHKMHEADKRQAQIDKKIREHDMKLQKRQDSYNRRDL
jgi:hypothetical protein